MATRNVGVHEAKTHLSKLLREIENGDEVVITRGGTPIARIVAPLAKRPVAESYGIARGQMWIADDFDDDDDEMARLFGIID